MIFDTASSGAEIARQFKAVAPRQQFFVGFLRLLIFANDLAQLSLDRRRLTDSEIERVEFFSEALLAGDEGDDGVLRDAQFRAQAHIFGVCGKRRAVFFERRNARHDTANIGMIFFILAAQGGEFHTQPVKFAA